MTKFCTCTNSCAVGAWAKVCLDMNVIIDLAGKHNFGKFIMTFEKPWWNITLDITSGHLGVEIWNVAYASNFFNHLKISQMWPYLVSLRWRHNGHDGISNHQPQDCLLNPLFRRRSKKTSKLRVTGLCVGNSPGTGEFPAQMASCAENVSIWCRHHVMFIRAIASYSCWVERVICWYPSLVSVINSLRPSDAYMRR